MLCELHIEALGVIDTLTLCFGPGLTAVTGETGAGKTLLVDALGLLLGGRADPSAVRHGCPEARVEGRFLVDGEEHIATRVVPVEGRSRAYLDGRPITAAMLTELVGEWVELHGQHSHQRLVTGAEQRAALDAWAGTDLSALAGARIELAAVERDIAALGGDERSRQRHLDLLRFQHDELSAARLDDPDEEQRLAEEFDVLANAEQLRLAAAEASSALRGDGGALDALGSAVRVLGAASFQSFADRLRAVIAELDDVAAELRHAEEAIVEDPERISEIRGRRQALHDLRRKYGETLAEVIDFRDEVAAEIDLLGRHDEQLAELERRRRELRVAERAAAAQVAAVRRGAAPALGTAVAERLRLLAMPHAELTVGVGGDDPGDQVEMLLAANPGSPPLPLARTASGGELARTMLAVRLVLSDAAHTMVFDEVDAGIGGRAAAAVGEALAELATHRQVLVVTHLAQVAALADNHLQVTKRVDQGTTAATTTATVTAVEGESRVTEIARLLSGHDDSAKARAHAAELLAGGR